MVYNLRDTKSPSQTICFIPRYAPLYMTVRGKTASAGEIVSVSSGPTERHLSAAELQLEFTATVP